MFASCKAFCPSCVSPGLTFPGEPIYATRTDQGDDVARLAGHPHRPPPHEPGRAVVEVIGGQGYVELVAYERDERARQQDAGGNVLDLDAGDDCGRGVRSCTLKVPKVSLRLLTQCAAKWSYWSDFYPPVRAYDVPPRRWRSLLIHAEQLQFHLRLPLTSVNESALRLTLQRSRCVDLPALKP